MMIPALKAGIRRLLEEKGAAVIAVDGSCAAGKTSLAAEIAGEFPARVFHGDDYFLRPEQRTPERLGEPGGNFDRERFAEEIAGPARRRETVRYRAYSCAEGRLSEWRTSPFAPVTIAEGSYCLHPALGAYYDISVFMSIAPDEQRRRILQRDGPHMYGRFVNEWIPMENAYFEALDIRRKCDFAINGG